MGSGNAEGGVRRKGKRNVAETRSEERRLVRTDDRRPTTEELPSGCFKRLSR